MQPSRFTRIGYQVLASSPEEVASTLTSPSNLILDSEIISVASWADMFAKADISFLIADLSLSKLDEMINTSEKVSNMQSSGEKAEKVKKMATLVMFQCKELKSAKLEARQPTRIYCHCILDLDELNKEDDDHGDDGSLME